MLLSVCELGVVVQAYELGVVAFDERVYVLVCCMCVCACVCVCGWVGIYVRVCKRPILWLCQCLIVAA